MGKKRLTKEQFIERSIKKHGIKYDYSEVIYESANKKVKIICDQHGLFEQLPPNHYKYGCILCSHTSTGKNLSHNKEKFIKRAKDIHGDLYDYSEVDYINARTKVTIKCHKHGNFYMIPDKHINLKRGCNVCSKGFNNEQKSFLYIQKVMDNETPIAIKVGITMYVDQRIKQHNRKSIYDHEYIKVYETTGIKTKILEGEIKSKFVDYRANNITKLEIQDGYTETFSLNSLDKIINFIENENGLIY